ncbi:MAG: hypothetical protein OXL36_17095 [Bryobacterales bacterium]|nr:hypothetical protein [Bryobacterales bacterium]MDE0296714.1 hypothetical protein [Bryobacterales bacterium]
MAVGRLSRAFSLAAMVCAVALVLIMEQLKPLVFRERIETT